MIKESKSTSPVAEALINFIEKYEGENTEEFGNLMAKTIVLLLEYEEARIKAEGYDKLSQIRGDFEKQMNVIKEEYKDLEAGKLPANPPVGEGLESLE